MFVYVWCHFSLQCNKIRKDNYEVLSNNEWIPLEDYLENMDETLHEVIRKNIVTSTRNYQQRVQTLMNTIVRNPNNPLSVKHFSSKLEFAGRGAGHNHGVLWLDINFFIELIEKYIILHQKGSHKSNMIFFIYLIFEEKVTSPKFNIGQVG